MGIVAESAPPRTWPTLERLMELAPAIRPHPALPACADTRLHVALWALDRWDGELPADAPDWLRAATVDACELAERMARRAEWSAEERAEWLALPDHDYEGEWLGVL